MLACNRMSGSSPPPDWPPRKVTRLQAYRFEAATEQLRSPRVVRIGLIQHGMVAPTTAPIEEQRQVTAAVCPGSTEARCSRLGVPASRAGAQAGSIADGMLLAGGHAPFASRAGGV